MKRFCSITLLSLIFTGLFAQKVEKAKELLKNNKLVEAKTEIDKFLAKEENQENAEAWYAKVKIYSAISLDPNLKMQVPDARMEAFNALKKYTREDRLETSLRTDGLKPVTEIYGGYYNQASSDFVAKKYDLALVGFKNAISVSTFMNEKEWIKMSIDTNAVILAGMCCERLNKPEDAVKHYGQIVVYKIKREGIVEVYKWVANYFYQKKDITTARRFIARGREVYPDEPFWESLEAEIVKSENPTPPKH